jgi:F-type H+-transporting ATPase subunit a
MEQYNIYTVIPSILGLEINNIVFVMIIALTLSISLLWVGISRDQVSLNNWSVITETMYHTNLKLVSSYIGMNNRIYFPLLYTIFYFILFSNVLGLLPYSTTSTVELVITLTITSTMLLGLLVIGYQNLNTKLFAILIPSGTPFVLLPLLVFLELMAYITKILSLG